MNAEFNGGRVELQDPLRNLAEFSIVGFSSCSCFLAPACSSDSKRHAAACFSWALVTRAIQRRIPDMGVSENRGPEYSTLNSRILIIRTPKKGTLILGNSHIVVA